MSVFARLQPLTAAPDERRRSPRLLLKLDARLGSGSTAVVHDLSTKGLLFETTEELGADSIDVHLPEVEPAAARVVWSHGRFYGCEFDEPIPTSSVSAALLRSEPTPPAAPSALASTDSGEKPAEAPHSPGRSTALAAGAIVVAAAVWLVVSGHVFALAALAVGALTLVAVLGALLLWATDNSLDLKL